VEAGIALANRSWLASAPNEEQMPHYKFFPCQIEGDAAFVFVDVDAHERVDRLRDRYVGRITRSGFREFYVYTRRSKTVWQEFLARQEKKSGYDLGLRFTAGKSHRA
jgi:hypothetical protein